MNNTTKIVGSSLAGIVIALSGSRGGAPAKTLDGYQARAEFILEGIDCGQSSKGLPDKENANYQERPELVFAGHPELVYRGIMKKSGSVGMYEREALIPEGNVDLARPVTRDDYWPFNKD
jgi:hypothetical protein